MNYDQYRPAKDGQMLVCIHVVLLQSLWLHSSPVANDGLWVKEEQGTAKQWWALQQPHTCNFKTRIMINIDQLATLFKISWHS
jgi:hypothetical protein